MAGMNLSAQVDTSVLNGAILELDKVSRRSLHEQAVTSIGWICSNAQKLTPAVSVARIDADLEAFTTPAVLKSGKLSKDKTRQHEVVNLPEGGRGKAATGTAS